MNPLNHFVSVTCENLSRKYSVSVSRPPRSCCFITSHHKISFVSDIFEGRLGLVFSAFYTIGKKKIGCSRLLNPYSVKLSKSFDSVERIEGPDETTELWRPPILQLHQFVVVSMRESNRLQLRVMGTR